MKKTSTGGYVDGFVFTVPKKHLEAYKKMAKLGAKVWMKHGALDYKECVGEDLVVKSMGGTKPLSFPKLTNAKKGDTVWFSFITFKSRAHRDAVNAKVMKDPEMNDPKLAVMPMPFDPAQMAYGGFSVEVGK